MGDIPNKTIMGLDMYLSKKTYVQNWRHMQPSEIHKVDVKLGGKKHPHINPKRVTYIVEEAMSWRKANHIHRWFVENVQGELDNCGEYYVDRIHVQELVDLCKAILNKEVKPEDALPTQEGFFFGGTEYDEYYYGSLQETVDTLTPILEQEGDFQFYYTSSW